MVNSNLDTVKYVAASTRFAGYDLIRENLTLVEEKLLAEQPGQPRLIGDAAVQILQAGGKRIRAAISLLSAANFDADLESSISLAAGVEMLHTATLVHDDIIDGADHRRNEPTLNASLDVKRSVLIGDYFFARAANLVADTNNLDIMKQFSKTLMTILAGEVNQQMSRWQLDRRSYFDRIYAKTGAMFVLAAKSAATLAGAEKTHILAFEKFGHYTGIAFQIVDDVLDFTSSPGQLGKPVGSDIREGIFTLPVLHFAKMYPNDPDLRVVIESQDGDHPAIDKLISKIQASGAADQALHEAKNLVSIGQQALDEVPYSAYVEALSSLGTSMINRVA